MSVAVTVSLPSADNTGILTYVPLGGDGYAAPQSLYEVGITLANDASGGTSIITLQTDPQYMSIITAVDSHHNSSLAAQNYVFALRTGVLSTLTSILRFGATSILVGSLDMCGWSPPPLVRAVQVNVQSTNIDTESHILNAWIYNFRRDAAHKVPLNILLASLPRTGRGWP